MSHEFDFKAKDVFWRDTFYNSKKISFIQKVSLEETFHNSTNSNIYWKSLFKRHLLQFQKIGFILKVSLEKTFSTIPQNPICIKNCGNDFKGKDVS